VNSVSVKTKRDEFKNGQIDLVGLKASYQSLITTDPIVKLLNQITL